jgi:hypothetical protein
MYFKILKHCNSDYLLPDFLCTLVVNCQNIVNCYRIHVQLNHICQNKVCAVPSINRSQYNSYHFSILQPILSKHLFAYSEYAVTSLLSVLRLEF